MRQFKVKMMRKFCYTQLTDLDHQDIRTEAHVGKIEYDEQGNITKFTPPQTLKYPQGHARRAYQDMKAAYLATPKTGRFVRG